MPAQNVVAQALRAVDTQRNTLIPGCGNWLLGQLHRFVTRRRLAIIAEKYYDLSPPVRGRAQTHNPVQAKA